MYDIIFLLIRVHHYHTEYDIEPISICKSCCVRSEIESKEGFTTFPPGLQACTAGGSSLPSKEKKKEADPIAPFDIYWPAIVFT